MAASPTPEKPAPESYPEAVAGALGRGLGAYVRATPARELPPSIRRFHGFRQAALASHRDRLLGVLEDEDFRARVLGWLDEGRPPLSDSDAAILRLASERPEGWVGEAAELAPAPASGAATTAPVELALERERVRARKARAEASRIKERAAGAVVAEKAQVAALRAEIEDLRGRLAAAEGAASEAEGALARAVARHERGLRRARRAEVAARGERDEARSRLKEARKESSARARRISELERSLEAATRRGQGSKRGPPESDPPGRRQALPVPQGLLEDDPKTLHSWLAEPGVGLLVDGYNVTRQEEGFGSLAPEGQRRRLVDEVSRLAVKHSIPATVVFDGAVVAPGTARRRVRGVKIEYSKPSETADDHLVAILDELPPEPVVAVTSDRELQDRARVLGATIATSRQLLGSIR